MKILVLGCGSIGKRHIKNLLTINAGRIFAYDVDNSKVDYVQKELSVAALSSEVEAVKDGDFDAAFICSPPSLHVNQALRLLRKGTHCFIEKPLSNTLENIDAFEIVKPIAVFVDKMDQSLQYCGTRLLPNTG